MMNAFKEKDSGAGVVDGANKALVEQSTMAVAGDKLSSMQVIEGRCDD